MPALTIIRGGGDLASGVALRLHRAGLRVMITELPRPLVVRRLVSFAEAVYNEQITVEGSTACLAQTLDDSLTMIDRGIIPVLVDPQANILQTIKSNLQSPIPNLYLILIDARMTKRPPELGIGDAELVIGLGPGFSAGENCHAVIETNRGHSLGRVIWDGPAEADTGQPEAVAQRRAERVLRAPAAGIFTSHVHICDHLETGQLIAEVSGESILAPFTGVLRGLLHPGLEVFPGMKVGDLDARDDPRFCRLVSDKSLAIGGGVLEAILSRPRLRPFLWT
jgi:xanthine dehydrogenase accessory factor